VSRTRSRPRGSRRAEPAARRGILRTLVGSIALVAMVAAITAFVVLVIADGGKPPGGPDPFPAIWVDNHRDIVRAWFAALLVVPLAAIGLWWANRPGDRLLGIVGLLVLSGLALGPIRTRDHVRVIHETVFERRIEPWFEDVLPGR